MIIDSNFLNNLLNNDSNNNNIIYNIFPPAEKKITQIYKKKGKNWISS